MSPEKKKIRIKLLESLVKLKLAREWDVVIMSVQIDIEEMIGHQIFDK